jgi:hypothetical protein
MPADGAWVRRVQRRALERALVDDVDARRYFALAGSLDAYRDSSTTESAGRRDRGPGAVADDAEGVLPAAMLSLAVVPHLADAEGFGPRPSVATTTTTPSGPTAPDPWSPSDDSVRPAVRRGARLALRWFDVSAAQVAARIDLPEATLTSREE